ncbi:uncharacterized protein HMPREF1541_10277 [Cyphellophora europaea CBS 101466]|uniref:Uncharacterized protein n=1 Tax=Cyphellophora europaea (strain CBS 101466) TaxID=1220924 RepID=W2S7E5_CYPE1|nr:uncharacterized protein HMPREF1541_10277 [Cyphellophora europaea CBS 101466]ETN44607.1 hypothetical protein HMPREF1541_10277 [Cyphellophora europaea CBS 101466]
MANVTPKEMAKRGIVSGTYGHRLEVLNNMLELSKKKPTFMERGQYLNIAYAYIEEILVGLIAHHELPMDANPDRESDDTHRYHEAVLKAIKNSSQTELRFLRGPVAPMLADAKRFRNEYKDYKKTNSEDGEALRPTLEAMADSFETGFPMIYKALKEAVRKSGLMGNRLN